MPSVLELKTRKRKDYKFNLEYRTRWYVHTYMTDIIIIDPIPLGNRCNYGFPN